ncbi:MAG: PD-(D/E)XK motif protein [Paracoccaceae bacterium]|nr:PD-(D/E)XK motif protein [Paracoccaceae bacterium]MDE2675432.1 PD-(D/E)XK motif protein [Paracoccaceae bacterium]
MLLEVYDRLKFLYPETCTQLFGSKIDGSNTLWMSINAEGHPGLLFESFKDDFQPDLKLKSVEVKFSRPCDIQLQDGKILSGNYTLVSLSNDDPDIIRVFLRLLEEAFCIPDADHSSIAIRKQILSIADLFSRVNEEIKDVLGLWGELNLIRNSTNIRAAVRAWTSSSNARFDFITKNYAIEVKTTLKSKRVHRFTLEQLCPKEDFTIYIVSYLLIETPNGETVSDLMDFIYENLECSEERGSFFRNCLVRGGLDIYGSELCFSDLPNNTSIAVFEANKLPVPYVKLDYPISNVRFDLDLSNFQALSNEPYSSLLNFGKNKG